MKVLHLVLKKKWYDMIATGQKTEEYRSITSYWGSRLIEGWLDFGNGVFRVYKDFDAICFHLGYTKHTMMFECLGIKIGTGVLEWGAESDKRYYIISIGKRLNQEEKL